MTPQNTELLARIEAFVFDEPGTTFTFAQRLAREHGWPADFTRRALREYRRFVFLAMSGEQPVCPSDIVDEVWHQHLTFTRNYWDEFCGKTLGRSLHHGPSRGGVAEDAKHREMYDATLARYRATFGEDAPADIWPETGRRFGDTGQFVRVNRREVWIVPKPAWLRRAALFGAPFLAVTLAGCREEKGSTSVFDLPGPDFLVFYFMLLVGALFVAGVMRVRAQAGRSSVARPEPPTDPYLVATLNGGPKLAVYAAMAELTRRKLVNPLYAGSISRVVGTPAPADLHPFERAVLETVPQDMGTMLEIRAKTKVETGALRGLLEQAGLLIPSEAARKFRSRVTWLLMIVIAMGVIKFCIGVGLSKPVFFLFLLIAAAVVTLILIRRMPERTDNGDRILQTLRWQNVEGNLKSKAFGEPSAAMSTVALGVGLYGLPFLMATPLQGYEYHVVPLDEIEQRPKTKDSGSSGDSSGCGGVGGGGCGGGGGGGGSGGCGGGGCGGCGGS